MFIVQNVTLSCTQTPITTSFRSLLEDSFNAIRLQFKKCSFVLQSSNDLIMRVITSDVVMQYDLQYHICSFTQLLDHISLTMITNAFFFYISCFTQLVCLFKHNSAVFHFGSPDHFKCNGCFVFTSLHYLLLDLSFLPAESGVFAQCLPNRTTFKQRSINDYQISITTDTDG